ncbi:hypothetical protein V5N11_024599 [Cardamine amara subsp. amara]|uniref:Calmodulin-binding domain-containing protein n=1 Tax=Cardamine amara subsp. amara TaxID=228776 RepID=A0ABD0ZQ67_CARAN
MAEENISQVDDKCCLDDAKPMEISVETMPYSSGALDKRIGKAQVQTRYRGNQMSSTHDLCKHGKRREDDLVIKPWKLVKKKNVEESGELGKVETLRKSLGNVSKPDKPSSSLQVAKREASGEIVQSCDGLRAKTKSTTLSGSAVVKTVKKTNLDVKKVSKISEDKSSKEDHLKNLKNREKTKLDEPLRSDDSLEKTNLDVKKVSRISEDKSSKEDNRLKNLKKKEKMKIGEPVRCDDSLEKTLYVVESSIEKKKKKKKKSIKSVKSEIQQSSEKKILRGSREKSLSLLPSLSPSSVEVKDSRVTRSDPRTIRQATSSSRSKTCLPEKKEIGSANLVTTSKTEIKIRPKKIGLKTATLPPPKKQLMSFKEGKVLDPKPEDSTPTLIKYKKRVVQEPKLRSDVNKKKKNLKDKREIIGKMNGETKREKVVLRHRKVEATKKLQTLFNNVIEETVNKLEEVRKSKVKALVGAFETVISLQDNDQTSLKKKTQRKSTSSLVVEG